MIKITKLLIQVGNWNEFFIVIGRWLSFLQYTPTSLSSPLDIGELDEQVQSSGLEQRQKEADAIRDLERYAIWFGILTITFVTINQCM